MMKYEVSHSVPIFPHPDLVCGRPDGLRPRPVVAWKIHEMPIVLNKCNGPLKRGSNSTQAGPRRENCDKNMLKDAKGIMPLKQSPQRLDLFRMAVNCFRAQAGCGANTLTQ